MKNNLHKLSQDIIEKQEYLNSEASTIDVLIKPFLTILGYDITNPTEIISEYDADSRLKKGDKVDIAILQNHKPIIFIECKKFGEDLDKHLGQLHHYFVACPEVRFAILTNGAEYRFYQESDNKSNTMDLQPFLEFTLTKKLTDSQITTISKFQRSEFNVEELFSSIDILKTENVIKSYMNQLILGKLDSENEFLNILIKETPYKGKRGENKQQFTSLANRFITEWVRELVQEKINNLAKQQVDPEIIEEQNTNNNIITLDSEIEAYYIIKSICSEKIDPHRISYKDYPQFFSIYLSYQTRKTLCKLYFTENTLEIDIDGNRVTIESLDELYNYKDTILLKLEEIM